MTLRFFPSDYLLPPGAKSGSGAAPQKMIRAPAWLKTQLGVSALEGERELSVEVHAPVEAVFGRWADFKRLPEFLEGIVSVTVVSDRRLHWVAELDGKRTEWDTEVEQERYVRIAWQGIGGSRNSGEATFEGVADGRTRLNVRVLTEGKWLGPDLDRFRELVEAPQK
jgi:uncharacterized membrane protein